MAEDLTEYLVEAGVKARYLHSEIDTLERIRIVRALRLGEFDVLVGVNLLREGLDLPEVTLVAILDADKEGFLRGTTSLDPDHRARRPQHRRAGDHVRRPRDRGDAHARSARPTGAARSRSPTTRSTASRRPRSARASRTSSQLLGPHGLPRRPRGAGAARSTRWPRSAPEELERMIIEREQEMFAAAEELRFELAARLRDEIADLRRELLERRGRPAATADGGRGRAGAARARATSAPVPRRSARRAAGEGAGGDRRLRPRRGDRSGRWPRRGWRRTTCSSPCTACPCRARSGARGGRPRRDDDRPGARTRAAAESSWQVGERSAAARRRAHEGRSCCARWERRRRGTTVSTLTQTVRRQRR